MNLSADPAPMEIPPSSEAAPPTVTLLKGTVRKVTEKHGNLITTFRIADFEQARINREEVFELTIGKATYQVVYGGGYADVRKGAWVAFAKPGGIIWIARNEENAATTAGAKEGTGLIVRTLHEPL